MTALDYIGRGCLQSYRLLIYEYFENGAYAWRRGGASLCLLRRRAHDCALPRRTRMSRLFDENHRSLQRRFDSDRLADRIEQRLCRDRLSDEDKQFIERLDMMFVATVSASGQPTCSYKGGDPGFVRVLDPQRLAFPHFDGNGMFLSAGNIVGTHSVGLLFVDFSSPKRLRVHGRASIQPIEAVLGAHEQAQFAVVVEVSEVFPNCPRYIHRYQLVERSQYVPRAGQPTPVPAWKQMDWAVDVLPRGS
jgi:predicted pyridoxine 5'-phosphate oxidase superfamily flavin-nucleotide-binding protein